MAGTIKHSKASRKRWKNIPEDQRAARMSQLSRSQWDKLDVKARRRRALRAARTRTRNKLLAQSFKS